MAHLSGVILGLVLLILGAELLVRGAVSLARRADLPPLLIGLTVVAFGTSTPEVAVSLGATSGGEPAVSLGNVLGSNVFNILVILGLSAVVAPLVVKSRIVRIDVPLMLAAAVLPLVLAVDGSLGRFDGIVLLAGLAAYLVVLGLLARQERRDDGLRQSRALSVPVSLLFVTGGLVLLGFGAGVLVKGASGLARVLGVGEVIIGLTVVAVGTSLPELATSVIAAVRDQRDLAVGNVLGSNVFNALGVLGAGALASGRTDVPIGVLMLDFPVMIAVSLACLPVFLTGATISRTEGSIFLFYYAVYMTYLGLHAADHTLHEEFGIAVVGAVLPLTLAVAGALWVRGVRDQASEEWRGGEGSGLAEVRERD
ncbi:MAG: calcium/sodium antiporter [Gemmatimonadales bacterium]|jgi:cation:H+ antiporter|nr:MAG: calcium/sodium antiporter [Gemmatimonadales bacterium]